ncbi:RidA family protein [Pusillimonas sp. CC-YST705]|uniref:RidA family protein n=1 Tax=Mesopusillimonas faecipullorum TaxID=2755040 RepID=A0ABS8CE90_9BURK|nr:RidA family protein [Mesopusillimonas faecipullorum]MCB5364351.1 RidA family protein [Mesopusillimonas faecipullorum]
MTYKVYNPKELPEPPPQTWSNIKVHSNGHFYVSGIVAEGNSMYEQTKKIFSSIKSLIEEAGGEMDDIMSLQIFVNNLNENTEVWRARQEFFKGDFPSSTLIEVSRVGLPHVFPPMRVEINCSGYIGGSR